MSIAGHPTKQTGAGDYSRPPASTHMFTEARMGTLILMEWMEDPFDGRDVKGFYGLVTIASDTAAVGFEAKGHNTANWIARVEGSNGEAITVMGCQVRAFREGVMPSLETSHYRVLG